MKACYDSPFEITVLTSSEANTKPAVPLPYLRQCNWVQKCSVQGWSLLRLSGVPLTKYMLNPQDLSMWLCLEKWRCCSLSLDPVDCSPPDSSVHGILQARLLDGQPCPSLGHLPNPGIKPRFPALQVERCLSHQGSLIRKALFAWQWGL